MDFQNFQKFNEDRILMSHKKFGPDRFSRFDVYWIQTNKQTDTQTPKQTDKPNLYIDSL